jgi:5'(3')-deoxyribonucleotidase
LKYYQIDCKVYLKFDLEYKKSLEPLSKIISTLIYKTNIFKELHKNKDIKCYTISNLNKVNKNGYYNKGKNSFTFRTVKK